MSRIILHCDMNNFYASVETLYDPSLKNKRIAVCGSVEDRHGIVLAKNEAAKKLGVKTGDTVWQAKLKCPDIVIVPPHFERYSEYSERARAIYSRYTDLVESFGMDECWLDVTGSTRLFGNGKEIADKIRNTVRTELGLTVSVGVSFNKVFAKLGSDLKKPDATTVIDESGFKEMIYDLPASSLLGVGRATSANIRRIGVDTIGELAALPRETLALRMGKHGETVWCYANGLDLSPVRPINCSAEIKSIGRGITAVRDLVNETEVSRIMYSLSRRVAAKLRENKLAAAGVQITVKNNKLVSNDYQCALPFETNSAIVIYKRACELFKLRYKWEHSVRSVTVRAIELVPSYIPRQLDFTYDPGVIERKERLDAAEDSIVRRFGRDAVKPMSLLYDLHIPERSADEIILPGFRP